MSPKRTCKIGKQTEKESVKNGLTAYVMSIVQKPNILKNILQSSTSTKNLVDVFLRCRLLNVYCINMSRSIFNIVFNNL